MKAVSVKEIKEELQSRSPKELMELCLKLSKFKKENKELLTYLLFEAGDESNYVQSVLSEIDALFNDLNTQSLYFAKKGLRKILKITKTYIRYSKKTETEIQLLLHYCACIKEHTPSVLSSVTMRNLFDRLIVTIKKKITQLHEDLQYDFQMELDDILEKF